MELTHPHESLVVGQQKQKMNELVRVKLANKLTHRIGRKGGSRFLR